MVSIQSKVQNNATLYAFFINEKNELLTIILFKLFLIFTKNFFIF